MASIFEQKTLDDFCARIEALSPESQPIWGKMTVNEMFAHCSLTFEYNNGQRQAKVNPLMKLLLKPMMRKVIVGPNPYKKNSPTAPYFKVNNPEEFVLEKERLMNNLTRYSTLGPKAAEAIEHVWLGNLTGDDWSRLMIKHLDHHLQQFGV